MDEELPETFSHIEGYDKNCHGMTIMEYVGSVLDMRYTVEPCHYQWVKSEPSVPISPITSADISPLSSSGGVSDEMAGFVTSIVQPKNHSLLRKSIQAYVGGYLMDAEGGVHILG